MVDDMKRTRVYVLETAYDCPYCGHTQGYTNGEVDYEEVKECDSCKNKFMLEK